MIYDNAIAAEIVKLIHADGLEVGRHLPARDIADRLRVSRSPVNDALTLLREKGLLMHERNRGFFLAKPVATHLTETVEALGLSESSVVTTAYFKIADDRLNGVLPAEFSEQLIRTRYALTATQLNTVLARIAQEGWAERKPGYGWEFSLTALAKIAGILGAENVSAVSAVLGATR
jgi:DNA-binding GntR family transcriptional regulator